MPRVRDFTFYRPVQEFDDLCTLLPKPPGPRAIAKSGEPGLFERHCVLSLRTYWTTAGGTPATGASDPCVVRAQVCKCFGGRYLSVTARLLDGEPVEEAVAWPRMPVPRQLPGCHAGISTSRWLDTRRMVEEIWECLTPQLGEDGKGALTGLIVVAGRTGSRKTTLADALVRRYLQHSIGSNVTGRRPHLVTFEDPIESPFVLRPAAAARRGYDYTPRKKGIDAGWLADAMEEALRQTPAVVYVGETRDPEDWKTLLHFAGTGHLVVTTAHAGSLVETMAQIVHAAEVKTPAQRSRVCSRIVALVHLRPEGEGAALTVVPAIWSRSPQAISAFTAEGMGSMLPIGIPLRPGGEAAPSSCYGRAYFVHKLGLGQQLMDQAIRWDLGGE